MVIRDINFKLKDGRKALLRSPKNEDVEGVLRYLQISAGETEFILRYPEECGRYDAESEEKLFAQKNESQNEAMLVCLVDGKIAGNCEILVYKKLKQKHRATIALALLSEYWNQGIGTKMISELIRIAKKFEDVIQIELEFIEGNERARRLYEKAGFRITGVRPNAIRLKNGTLLNEYMMIKELKK